MKRWYVVHTQPNGEAKAVANLLRQGYEPYLPKYRKLRRHARRTEMVERPLFPRYLFVALDVAATPWRAILSTVGVSDLLRRGNEPSPVPVGVVEDIQARDREGLLRLDAAPRLQPGDQVRMTEGALADLTGRILSLTDEQRVCVLLDLLGREVRAHVAAHALEPA